jgi:hypothetical protein
MHSDCFNGIEILESRWQHREKLGYCYPSGLEKTLCKWDMYVLLVRKGLMQFKLPFNAIKFCYVPGKEKNADIKSYF